MNRKISFGAACVLMIMVALLTFLITWVGSLRYTNARLESVYLFEDSYSKLKEIDDYVRRYYIGQVDEGDLSDGILYGYVAALGDPFSMYMNAEDYKESMQSMQGQQEGIGVTVFYDADTGYLKVVSVVENSPAENIGIHAGDILYKVGGEDIAQLGYYPAVAKIKGEAGTTVNLTVLRGNEELTFDVVRAVVQTKTVSYRKMESNIGYIDIESFDLTTTEEFKNALNELKKQGCDRFVFDVRHNPGGNLTTICDVLDMLLPAGPIIRIEYNDGSVHSYSSDASCLEMPMAVLIDENSYSAAELFAAALKDYEIATLVGTTTYGKGTMQQTVPLKDGESALHLSIAKYSPPFSENYHGVGVTPNMEVKLSKDVTFWELTDETDTQLAAAKAVLEIQ